jgi:hypothetical protein
VGERGSRVAAESQHRQSMRKQGPSKKGTLWRLTYWTAELVHPTDKCQKGEFHPFVTEGRKRIPCCRASYAQETRKTVLSIDKVTKRTPSGKEVLKGVGLAMFMVRSPSSMKPACGRTGQGGLAEQMCVACRVPKSASWVQTVQVGTCLPSRPTPASDVNDKTKNASLFTTNSIAEFGARPAAELTPAKHPDTHETLDALCMDAKITGMVVHSTAAGKSSLMRILAGEDKEFDGTLNLVPGIKIGRDENVNPVPVSIWKWLFFNNSTDLKGCLISTIVQI